MIRLSCTNCKTVLEIDDGFAGGACRCLNCGTIQTVPLHLKGGGSTPANESEAAARKLPQSKTLYESKKSVAVGSGTGLDDLGQAVASSGLSGSGLGTSKPARRTTSNLTPVKPKQDRKTMLIGAGLGAAVVLVAVVVFFATRGRSPKTPGAGPGGGSSADQVVAGPRFGATPIEGATVVYLLDRGSATQDYFGPMLEATYHSIESLGTDRKFQIVFWDNDEPPASFPADGPTFASKANIEQARAALEDVIPYGRSEWDPALKRAIGSKPDAIVLITGKGWDLDEAFAGAFVAGIGSAGAKVYAISLGSASDVSVGLQKLAEQTGGVYHSLSVQALRGISH